MSGISRLPSRLRGAKGLSSAISAFLAVTVLALTAWGSYTAGVRRVSSPPSSVKNGEPTGSAAESSADFGLFWEAWNTVNRKFFGDKDDAKRVEGAITGMVGSLGDPYTVYMSADENKLFRSDLQGSFGGIGAELMIKEGVLTIVAPLEDTPAERAGLKALDAIVEIDGKKTADMSFGQALLAIRGEKGTQVELTIARSGRDEPFKVKLSRETINVKSVKTDAVGEGDAISYVRITQFGEDTSALVRGAFTQAKSEGKKGMVLDLRDNPGGYLDTATEIVGMLVPKKPEGAEPLQQRVAVIERFKDGSERPYKPKADPIVPDLPLVVLVNSGSASASEILAGALKDYKRATVLGTKTFGKGSVQELQDLSNGGSIKVTVAKWFTPLGTGIDKKGIDPDTVVELPEQGETGLADAQMKAALSILEKTP